MSDLPGDVPGAGGRVLLVGLGNPGPRYAGNRHNVGFLVLDELAGRVGGRGVVLAKPRSYMNLSGGPVVGTARFYKLDASAIVVVHDELDLPYGTVRLKLGGGDNGHNGLRSITKSLGTKEYYRVRFGVGRPPGRMDAADYVLKDFSTVERRELALNVDRCADAVEELVARGLTAAQNVVHAT